MAKTKKRCFGLALAMLMLMLAGTGTLAVQAADDPLLKNGSFTDLKQDGTPENWLLSPSTGAVIVKEGDTGYVASPDGGNYVRLTGSNVLVQQEISGPVESGNYLFSAYVKYSFASAQSNSEKFGAMLTFYAYDENGRPIALPQSSNNNYEIYDTRGEWRRISFVVSVPTENTKVLCALRSSDITVTDLCYDGASLERIGDYDPDALIHYDMDDVAIYNGTNVPTDMVVYSAHGTVDDMSYGALGTNYKVATDTPDGSAYAMEMNNEDGSVQNGLSMAFHTGRLFPLAVYEVTGYIKVESEAGYARILTGRNRVSQDSLGAKSTYDFYDTDGEWKQFSFKLQSNLKLDGSNYPAGTVADAATGEYANSYIGYWRILFTGAGSVSFDDIRITRILDENRIGYNNNLAVGGDFESVGSVGADGMEKPHNSWVPGNASNTPWTEDNTASNGIMLWQEPGTTNTVLRVATDGAKDGYLNLQYLQMIPNKLYKLSWRQKAETGAATTGNVRIGMATKKFELDSVVYCPYYDNYNTFGDASEEWKTYAQYIRYAGDALPEQLSVYFRPSVQGDLNSKYAFYIDDVELCMVDEAETYGEAAFTNGEGTVTVNRMLLHDGTTWDDWANAKSYDMLTVVYLVSGTARQIYDLKVESKTVDMAKYKDEARKGLLAVATDVSQTVSVPTSGKYEVETYLWDIDDSLVPLVIKTLMPEMQ